MRILKLNVVIALDDETATSESLLQFNTDDQYRLGEALVTWMERGEFMESPKFIHVLDWAAQEITILPDKVTSKII